MNNHTICSIATPQGVGALSIIRLSGNQSVEICSKLLKNAKKFMESPSHYSGFYELFDNEQLIDQVMMVKYLAPHTYTGEEVVEITCHGSSYIQKKLIELLLQHGAMLANPGEFSMRAFLNNKLDLPQIEGVVDLIDSQSEMAHKLAIHQLKGGFSKQIKALRQQCVDMAALMTLELDFSEEEVEFVDRTELLKILNVLESEFSKLCQSFKLGNVLKEGIPVAIIGKPNVGKSTLLNAILNDERAIVSNTPGTTRDTVEGQFSINGTNFRFIDTAGLRSTHDEVENFGIARTYKSIDQAHIILYVVDIVKTPIDEIEKELISLENEIDFSNKEIVILANKIDSLEDYPRKIQEKLGYNIIFISAKHKVNLDELLSYFSTHIQKLNITDTTLLTNVRHYNIMLKIVETIQRVKEGFDQQLPTDIITVEINTILHYLGEITGHVTNDDILGTIFSRFCIGK